MCKVFCVANRKLSQEDYLTRLEKLAAAGADGVILREKDLSEEEYEALAEQVMKICRGYGVPCILHTFVDTAKKLHAEGIHIPLPVLRTLSSGDREAFSILGSSVHSVSEAMEAESLGCTYLVAGHIFETDCKKGIPGRGLSFLKEVCSQVSIPVYGIGGIHVDNVGQITKAGAKGCCIMKSAMECGEPEKYLEELRKEQSMMWKKEMLRLYAVTERFPGKELCEQIEDAIRGGVTLIQLREKNLPEDKFVEEAIAVKKICEKYQVPLIINDNLQVALKSGADGIHVGAGDMPVAEIRKQAGADFIIGATAKTVEQAKRAEAEGADYLGCGAVFPSPTKKDAIRITKEQLREITGAVSIPVAAIGGISLDNVKTLDHCGLCGIAVVSAVFGAEDVKKASEELRKISEEICEESGEEV